MPQSNVIYSKRTWLNLNESASTGSVVAFHGLSPWKSEDGGSRKIEKYIEIADCHNKIRLHQSYYDTHKEFAAKIRLLGKEVMAFADFLDNVEPGKFVEEITNGLRKSKKKSHSKV